MMIPRHRLPICVLVLFLAPLVVLAGSGATDLMGKALKLRSGGQLAEAVDLLRQAVGSSPNESQKSLAQFMLGDCLLEARRTEEAREVFQTILAQDPPEEEQAEARFRIAQAWQTEGEPVRMTKACQEIVRRHVRSPFAQLARLLLQSGKSGQGGEGPSPEPVAAADHPLEESSSAPAEPAPEPDRPEPSPVATRPPLPSPATVAVAGSPALAEPPSEPPASVPAGRVRFPPDSATSATDASPRTGRGLPQSASGAEPQQKMPSLPVADVATAKPVPVPVPAPAPANRSVVAPSQDTLKDLLTFPDLPVKEKEVLATDILRYQNTLRLEPDREDADRILFEMASATARFGELLEACKTYDKLLTSHPTSAYCEAAYFEAIRLRGMLKVYGALINWGKMFQETFPRSRELPRIQRLMDFALARRNVRNRNAASPASGKTPSPKAEPLEEVPAYREAKRHMSAGQFALALAGFTRLSRDRPQVPQVWWELALVQVQMEKFNEAARSLQKLLELDPGNEDARSLLGYVHYHQKDYEQAAIEYGKAGTAPEKKGLSFFDPGLAARRLQTKAANKATPAAKEKPDEQ